MVIEIECFKGDTLLYDTTEDNFLVLLCRRYRWNVLEEQAEPQYVYDRDIKKCILKKY